MQAYGDAEVTVNGEEIEAGETERSVSRVERNIVDLFLVAQVGFRIERDGLENSTGRIHLVEHLVCPLERDVYDHAVGGYDQKHERNAQLQIQVQTDKRDEDADEKEEDEIDSDVLRHVLVDQLQFSAHRIEIVEQLVQFVIAEALCIVFQLAGLARDVGILSGEEIDHRRDKHVQSQNGLKERQEKIGVVEHIQRHRRSIDQRVQLEIDVERREVENRGN